MSTTSMRRLSAGRALPVAVGLLGPLAIAVLAYVLWRISDALVYIGPFDRAQFGWGVVIPVWLAVPVVASFLWARLGTGRATQAAIALNAVITVPTVWLLWRAAVDSGAGCQFGPAISSEQRLVQAIVVGVLIGLDPAVAGLVGRRFAARGETGRAVVAAIGVGFALFWVAVLGGAAITMGPGCNRPMVV